MIDEDSSTKEREMKMDELFAKVEKALKYCDEETEQGEQVCPDDCPYKWQCWSENPEDQGPAAELVEDMKRLILQQQRELIRLRDQAQCVELKSEYSLQQFKYRLENTTDVERSEFIRAHLMNDLIQACEKMGLIAYERDVTEEGGPGPMVSITATLRVHKPETAERMAT